MIKFFENASFRNELEILYYIIRVLFIYLTAFYSWRQYYFRYSVEIMIKLNIAKIIFIYEDKIFGNTKNEIGYIFSTSYNPLCNNYKFTILFDRISG